jgi:exopolysaccharide/PEP-CTERM locus tyrosine autokinase
VRRVDGAGSGVRAGLPAKARADRAYRDGLFHLERGAYRLALPRFDEALRLFETKEARLGRTAASFGVNEEQAVEEYRNVKRPLIVNAFGVGSVGIDRSNLILVTSSIPGEGKTFTAINLALSIANERDKKVLLIDADVARPSISKTLGIKSSPGLIEYLEGQDIEFSDIVLKTNMPGLSVIPSGKQHKHSTELLTSNRMALLAQELSNRYPDRMVIFDSPPLLAATQGEVLAGLVGQVILVVEAEKTPQSMIMASVNKLVFCDVVLVLLNKTLKNVFANNYGYGLYGL